MFTHDPSAAAGGAVLRHMSGILLCHNRGMSCFNGPLRPYHSLCAMGYHAPSRDRVRVATWCLERSTPVELRMTALRGSLENESKASCIDALQRRQTASRVIIAWCKTSRYHSLRKTAGTLHRSTSYRPGHCPPAVQDRAASPSCGGGG